MSTHSGNTVDLPIQMCIDRPLPDELDEKAKLQALVENPYNIVKARPGDPIQLAGDTRKFWKPGTELHIRFMHDSPSLQAKVIQYAQLWLQHVNLKFVFDDSPTAQIRIGFEPGIGSMSRVGLDALQDGPDQATMNLDPTWFVADPGDVILKRTVLHEFGHALGCIHEHQSPKARISWNVEEVLATFGGPPYNWSPEDIRFNILDRANTWWTNSTEFDKHSIMLYPIDSRLTTDGYHVDWNNDLSQMDKDFIGLVYP